MSSTAVMTVLAPQPSILDDEITAWNLQLEEAGIQSLRGKGKFPAGSPPDSAIAFDNFHGEIEAHLSFLRDVKLAHSIALAVNTDADVIAELAVPEEQAQDDRDFAMHVSGFVDDDYDSDEAGPSASFSTATPRWLSTTAAFTRVIDETEDANSTVIEAPHNYTSRQANAFEKLSQEFDCSVCFETFHAPSVISLECGDRYCLDCLKDLFVRATRDETLFPPRCCRLPIAVTVVANELTSAQLNAFQLAEMEFSTGDRTYCSNHSCASFIPAPDVMADKAFCRQCGGETCAICKGDFHQDTDCPYDPALHGTLELAERENWQRCHACRQLVELDVGCNHMTCKCGAQFCYICGNKWKTCQCDLWSENRLYTRAQEVVRRDAPRALPHAQLDRRVEHVTNRLRANAECTHPEWNVRGPMNRSEHALLQCDMCRGMFRELASCTQCDAMACRDCRRNQMR